jgi:3-dehydroquinate synthetase
MPLDSCVFVCCAVQNTPQCINNATLQSYEETEHRLDVFETITEIESTMDLFVGTRTNSTLGGGAVGDANGFLDACRYTLTSH